MIKQFRFSFSIYRRHHWQVGLNLLDAAEISASKIVASKIGGRVPTGKSSGVWSQRMLGPVHGLLPTKPAAVMFSVGHPSFFFLKIPSLISPEKN